MDQVVDVFAFRGDLAGRSADTRVCVAEAVQSAPFLSRDEIDRTVFGYVLFTAQFGKEYIGVWGARNASRFRRLLRERGAELRVHVSPPSAPLSRLVTHGKARAEATKIG